MSGKNEMDFGTFSLWVIMGVAIGSVFGVALGNIAIGISLGMMGGVVGALFFRSAARDGDTPDGE